MPRGGSQEFALRLWGCEAWTLPCASWDQRLLAWPRCSLAHNLRAPPAPLQVPGGRPQHWQSRGWLPALCNEGAKWHTPLLLQRVPASPGLLFIPRHQWRLEPERVFLRHALEMPFPSPAPLTLMRHSASKPVCGPLKGHRVAGEARATLTLSVLPLGAALGRGPPARRGRWDPQAGCSRWHLWGWGSGAWSGREWHELAGTIAAHSWPGGALHSTVCLLGRLLPLRRLLSCPQLSPLVRERCSLLCRSSGSLGEPLGAFSPAAAPQEQPVRACGAVPGDSRPLLAGCGPAGAPHWGLHLAGPMPCCPPCWGVGTWPPVGLLPAAPRCLAALRLWAWGARTLILPQQGCVGLCGAGRAPSVPVPHWPGTPRSPRAGRLSRQPHCMLFPWRSSQAAQ